MSNTKKWEYMIDYCKIDVVSTELNVMGKEGWEYAGKLKEFGSTFFFILKRPYYDK